MDFYILLGLERAATLIDIKRAYRRLARRYHPDINPGDRLAAAQFRQIAEAYETLSDPERRRRYDTAGAASAAARRRRSGSRALISPSASAGRRRPTFGDLFADVLQPRDSAPGTTPERGADLHQSLALTLRGGDARRRSAQVVVTRQEHCSRLRGDGRACRTAESRCLQLPRRRHRQVGARAHGVLEAVRRAAAAPAVRRRRRCPALRRTAARARDRNADGAHAGRRLADGARIRVPGKGHAGRSGGEPRRSLHHRATSSRIRCSGAKATTCTSWCRSRVHEAALGAKIDVPSLDGRARLRVPPGTQSGQRFRLRERGVPSARDGRRGDLVVEVRLVLPRLLDERSKELLREFGRINAEDVRDGMLHDRDEADHEEDSGKAYYMISAVAQKYNIHPQTLRLYEREGLLKPSRTEGNTRLYSEEDLEQLETILSLTRDLGVNLAGVEIILNMRRKIERMQQRGQRVHGVREARARARHRRLGAAALHRARQVVADRSRCAPNAADAKPTDRRVDNAEKSSSDAVSEYASRVSRRYAASGDDAEHARGVPARDRASCRG